MKPTHPSKVRQTVSSLAGLIAVIIVVSVSSVRGGEKLTVTDILGGATQVQAKIDHGADPNHMDDESSGSPLDVAVNFNSIEVARVLLDHHADPNQKDRNGNTPLSAHAAFMKPEFARLLLDHGADPNAADQDGDTPVHAVASLADTALLRLLLDKGGDPNIRNKNGLPPLARAIFAHQVESIKLLLAKGADPDIQEQFGDCPRKDAQFMGLKSLFDGIPISRLPRDTIPFRAPADAFPQAGAGAPPLLGQRSRHRRHHSLEPDGGTVAPSLLGQGSANSMWDTRALLDSHANDHSIAWAAAAALAAVSVVIGLAELGRRADRRRSAAETVAARGADAVL